MARAKGGQRNVSNPKILTGEAAKAVGRPGFGRRVPGPAGRDKSVTRLMRNDPSVGITQPGADAITTGHVDLVGEQGNIPIVGGKVNAPKVSAGKKTVVKAYPPITKR